jgi:hypothetical protein
VPWKKTVSAQGWVCPSVIGMSPFLGWGMLGSLDPRECYVWSAALSISFPATDRSDHGRPGLQIGKKTSGCGVCVQRLHKYFILFPRNPCVVQCNFFLLPFSWIMVAFKTALHMPTMKPQMIKIKRNTVVDLNQKFGFVSKSRCPKSRTWLMVISFSGQ